MCPLCREEREKKFQEVKKYIQDHRLASINDVSEDCEVEVNQIHQWIREERLQFAEDSPIRVNCEKCGAMIRAGVYCEKCKMEMANNLSSAYKKEMPIQPEPRKTPSERDRMRFLDR
jgi:methionyl-tRNA synthetase